MRFLSFRPPGATDDAATSWGFLVTAEDAPAPHATSGTVSAGTLAVQDAGQVPGLPAEPGAAVVDVRRLAASTGRPYPADLMALIQMPAAERGALLAGWREPDRQARASAVPLGEVEVLAPLPHPRRNVFAVGANYRDHVEESSHSAGLPAQPIFFSKATTAVVGPGPVTVDPALTTRVDWEVELAVVVGATARHLSVSDALDAVFGYATANDLSARDQQHDRPEGQWFLGKSLDGFCPMGQWLVTADEVPDPQGVELRLDVNGEVKQQASTKAMIFTVAELLAELSRFVTLLPGDILLTGTPSGVGDARTPPEYLTDGDVVVAEAVGVGRLATRIVHRSRP